MLAGGTTTAHTCLHGFIGCTQSQSNSTGQTESVLLYIHSNYQSVYCINLYILVQPLLMGHTSHAHWSEVDRIRSGHLASGEWSLEWVGHTVIWDTPTGVIPTGGEVVCSRVTRVTESPDTQGRH